MTEMLDWQILQILQMETIAAVAACSMPNLPVKFIGRSYTPPNDQKWLEIVFLPNNRNSDFWGNEKNYRGTYRLILHWPNNDEGAYQPMQLLSEITSRFAKGTLMQNVQIYEAADSAGALEQGSETLYPASIRYVCYKQ